MIPPVLHDVHAASKIVKRSPSWLYKKGAAGEIPRTKIGGGVFWTDEQCAQIIRDGAQPKRRKQRDQQVQRERRQEAPKRETQRKSRPVVRVNAGNVPVADFSVSRLYKNGGAS
ncbi:hypothetical protein ABGB18_11390 [Nonomuraea sp. B12E4]|uniref:hypothetical protein n=1 Tax=Nonomuraea sp. B12E4 TaxID=3153564 RepID=UPI00325E1F39